jgi:hypothetical protein
VTEIRVVQYGLGPIGQEMARVAAARPGVTLVGGIDISPALVGRTLKDVLGLREPDVSVSSDGATVLSDRTPDVVLHATGSSLPQVAPQLEEAIRGGASVISTCEELAWPFLRHPELSATLDELARQHGVRLLGAGVNPGFVMDKLAITLMGACQEVHSISIERSVDAARRREPLQRKVGAGLTRAKFEGLVAAGKVRHVGLTESVYMIIGVLGLEDAVVTEEIGPVIAERDMSTEYLEVRRGQAAGVQQVARAMVNGVEIVTLKLRMAVGVGEQDRIIVDGVPPLDMTITLGFCARASYHGGYPLVLHCSDCTSPVMLVRG